MTRLRNRSRLARPYIHPTPRSRRRAHGPGGAPAALPCPARPAGMLNEARQLPVERRVSGAGYYRQLTQVLLISSRPARHLSLPARFGQIAPYRPLVGVVQRAVFGAVPAVAVMLKLVLMPGDTRPLDCGTLVIIHVPSSPPICEPLPQACGRAVRVRCRGGVRCVGPGCRAGVAPGPFPGPLAEPAVRLGAAGSPRCLPSGGLRDPGGGDLAAAVAIPDDRAGGKHERRIRRTR